VTDAAFFSRRAKRNFTAQALILTMRGREAKVIDESNSLDCAKE